MTNRGMSTIDKLDRSQTEDVVTTFAVGADPIPVRSDEELAPGCSVVICTYNRRDAVQSFLDSLAEQGFPVPRLVIVDASPGDETEQMIRRYPRLEQLAESFFYFRVRGSLRGLTRQRNFSLHWIGTELVVFFDDDVVLLSNCLREMKAVHRSLGEKVVGVGATIENEPKNIPLFWRTRRALGIVSTLRPGSYCRSGFAVPWNFLPPTDEWVEGEWLRGCAMMWKTRPARIVGFNSDFTGSSIGEDVDFSLRMSDRGKLIVAGKARILHFPDRGGRIDACGSGYMGISNSYSIHRRCLPQRTRKDAALFVYAYGLDTLMRMVNLIRPGSTYLKLGFLRGRLRFFAHLLWRKHRAESW